MNWFSRLLGLKESRPAAPHLIGSVPEDAPVSAPQPPAAWTRASGQFICAVSSEGRGASGGSPTSALALLDEEGTLVRTLAQPAPGEWFGQFDVSADARWVAYTAYVSREKGQEPVPEIR